MCFDNCLFGNSKKENVNINLFRANIYQSKNSSNIVETKIAILDLFKSQVKYKLYTDLPNNTQSFHYIFINKLTNDNFKSLTKYLGTFISYTDLLSLSFKFVILDIVTINSRQYYRISIELDNKEDIPNNTIWYILTTSSL